MSGQGLDKVTYVKFENLGLWSNTDGRVDWPGVRVLDNHNQALVFTASYFLDADSWIPTRGDGESRTALRNGVVVGNGEGGVVPEGEDCVGCCVGFSCGPKGGGNQQGVSPPPPPSLQEMLKLQ
ncbi:hypothetical protein KIW84_058428 [Lathyrus oleraceus]|uniref:Pectinesterase catalytic domain-containing protein n=1 Tax=Pisum sativum TaxID=3888 RepID=A0A9D4X8X6_PEA|nr:hypothetical protein KIW84_058428 [Pisum sativum]